MDGHHGLFSEAARALRTLRLSVCIQTADLASARRSSDLGSAAHRWLGRVPHVAGDEAAARLLFIGKEKPYALHVRREWTNGAGGAYHAAIDLTLFGSAVELADAVIDALVDSGRREGFRVAEVFVVSAQRKLSPLVGEGQLRTQSPITLWHVAQGLAGRPCERLVLLFSSRYRMTERVHVLSEPGGSAAAVSRVRDRVKSLEWFVKRLIDRADALGRQFGGGPVFDRNTIGALRQLHAEVDFQQAFWWQETEHRDLRSQPLGGVCGWIDLAGNLQALLPWLAIGEWTQVGRSVTKGLGHYELLVDAACPPLRAGESPNGKNTDLNAIRS